MMHNGEGVKIWVKIVLMSRNRDTAVSEAEWSLVQDSAGYPDKKRESTQTLSWTISGCEQCVSNLVNLIFCLLGPSHWCNISTFTPSFRTACNDNVITAIPSPALCVFAGPSRYGTLVAELSNQFAAGRNDYPSDLNSAYSLLVVYLTPLNARQTRNTGSGQIQGSNGQGTEGSASTLTQNGTSGWSNTRDRFRYNFIGSLVHCLRQHGYTIIPDSGDDDTITRQRHWAKLEFAGLTVHYFCFLQQGHAEECATCSSYSACCHEWRVSGLSHDWRFSKLGDPCGTMRLPLRTSCLCPRSGGLAKWPWTRPKRLQWIFTGKMSR